VKPPEWLSRRAGWIPVAPFPAWERPGRGVAWLEAAWVRRDLLGNPADKLQAELKSVAFKFELKSRRMLGCLAELVLLTAEVASLLTLPAAVFKSHHIFGDEFECFLMEFGSTYFIQRLGKLNAVFSRGVGVTNLSKVWVIKHHADSTRGKVLCKPQSIGICALSILQLGEGVGRGTHPEVSKLQAC